MEAWRGGLGRSSASRPASDKPYIRFTAEPQHLAVRRTAGGPAEGTGCGEVAGPLGIDDIAHQAGGLDLSSPLAKSAWGVWGVRSSSPSRSAPVRTSAPQSRTRRRRQGQPDGDLEPRQDRLPALREHRRQMRPEPPDEPLTSAPPCARCRPARPTARSSAGRRQPRAPSGPPGWAR